MSGKTKVTFNQSYNISSRNVLYEKGTRRKGAYSVINITGEIVTDDEDLLNILKTSDSSFEFRINEGPYRDTSPIHWMSGSNIICASHGADVEVEEIP